MNRDRARALFLECGYQAKEREVVGSDGTVRVLTETMAADEYDEVMSIWISRSYGSFRDVLLSIANPSTVEEP